MVALQDLPELLLLADGNFVERGQRGALLPTAGRSFLPQVFIGDAREQIDLLFLHDHAIGGEQIIRARAGEKVDGGIDRGFGGVTGPDHQAGGRHTEGTGQVVN